MSDTTILIEVEESTQVIDIQVEQNPAVLEIEVSEKGLKGDKGDPGIQGIPGDKGDPGDPASNLITSVNGKQGVVVLDKTDIGLGNVDNTSDADKPISSATSTALSNKVDKVSGKGLSTEDYTTVEKSKLSGIAEGAEVNVNADWNSTSGDSEILNKPDLSIYSEKQNVLQLDNITEFTPDADYEPATKKYVDDNAGGNPAGNDASIQFNDNGVFGGVDAFKYDRVSGAITVGEFVEVFPSTPLAIQRENDDYLQVTLKNTSDSAIASGDFVITADNGTDETHYIDLGINSSTYYDIDYPIFSQNDAYLDAPDDNIFIGTGDARKTIGFYVGGYETTNIKASIDVDGINLPAGNTFRINGTPIGSAPDFLALTDSPDSYTGQSGKAVTVKATEDGLEFTSLSGLGDMLASTYDPNGVASDVFNTDNHVSGTVNKVYTATEQTKLAGIASGAEVNVQADWNESNSSSDAFIKNKPTIPEGHMPASSVVSETSYGQAPSVGISNAYARADHTHGTPAGGTGISEAQAIAYSCALGGI